MSSFPLNDHEIQDFIDVAFAEDVGTGDVTAESVIPEDAKLTASMNARQELVLAGLPLVANCPRAWKSKATACHLP